MTYGPCKLRLFALKCPLKKMENKDAEYYMNQALDLAKQAYKDNEVPVGAVIVKNDKIIGRGYNSVIKNSDPSSHAEIVALREAGKQTTNYRILDSELYVTLETCLMCYSAMVNARIKKLYFGAFDFKTGVFSTKKFDQIQDIFNHKIDLETGLLQEESSDLLKNFFKERRDAGAVERDGLENR
jgi:tRNA(adenine34) deaminase